MVSISTGFKARTGASFIIDKPTGANIQFVIPTKRTTGAPSTGSFGDLPGTLVWNNTDKKLFIRGSTTWSSAIFA